MMYFLSILACTFWGADAERSLDQFFGGLPVALYVKYVCLIAVCHLYRQMLHEVIDLPYSRWLDNIGLAAIVLGFVSFVNYAWQQPISLERLRYIIIGARDAVIVAYIFTTFLRGVLTLLRREKILAIRLKLISIAVFFVLFSLSACGSTSAAILTILDIGDPAYAARVLQPFLYVAILFFVLTLIPYRWFAGVHNLSKLLLYQRLLGLEKRVYDLADIPTNNREGSRLLLRSQQIELAIYRTVISILDAYSLISLDGDSHPLTQHIRDSVAKHPHYGDLVQALARWKDV